MKGAIAMTKKITTRRKVLSSITCGATLAFSPTCLANYNRPLSKLSFLVASDTHLGYKNSTTAEKRWSQAVAELKSTTGDLVLHLGDVVDGGREDQYAVYLREREKIGKPVYEIPGNHDPLDLFRKHIRRQIDVAIDHKWLKFVLVGNAHTDSHHGFLTDEQLKWIESQCHAAVKEQRYVMLCLHVPVHSNRHPDRGWYVKPENGQTKLYDIIKRYKQHIVAMLHGHFHNGVRGWKDDGGIHEICLPSVLYNLDRGLEKQKAAGYNPLEFRAGYTMITIDNGLMTLDYKPLGADVSINKKFEFDRA
jgi:Icc-related predicted phosphoesterase